MKTLLRAARVPASMALLALLSACSSTPSRSHGEGGSGRWLEPSPVLRQQIDDQVQRLPWTHGPDRVEQIRWFASVGEPAYDRLLELCLDPRPDVTGSALAALGATGDSRLVEPLQGLRWPEELDRGVELERARTYVRLGDWTQLDVLVAGLRDESLWARAWCSQALFEATKQRFGFDPRAEAAEREEAVRRWEEWVQSRRSEGLLATAKPGEKGG